MHTFHMKLGNILLKPGYYCLEMEVRLPVLYLIFFFQENKIQFLKKIANLVKLGTSSYFLSELPQQHEELVLIFPPVPPYPVTAPGQVKTHMHTHTKS